MADAGLIAALWKQPKSDRDKVLVMIAVCLPERTVDEITTMTLEKAEEALAGRPEDAPFRDRSLTVLRAHARNQGIEAGDLLFPSSRQFPHPGPVPLSRIQAWRVVRNAVTAVLGDDIEGAWTVIRAAARL